MPTIQKGKIEYDIHPAPSSPLNLKMGVIYAPRRVESSGGGFHGYSCVEVEPRWFVVAGWGGGRTVALFEDSDLGRAWRELAKLLGMS